MMRSLTWSALSTGLLLSIGCHRNEAGPGSPSGLVARYQFVGTGRLAGEANARKLQEIARLRESQALVEQTLQRLARSPRTLFRGSIAAEQTERGAALLRPLLDDLVREESAFELRGPDAAHLEWTLSVALKPERLALWRTNLTELLRLWKVGEVTRGTIDGLSGAEVKRAAAPTQVRWVETGAWLILGVGDPPLSGFNQSIRQAKAGGRPVPPLTDAWLEVEGDLGRLAGPLELSPRFPWPQVQLNVASRGENLRSTARLLFPEAVTGPLQPWHVPTHIITEPLVSFTAARGIAPLTRRSETLRTLNVDPPPNEVYFWAQSAVVFQSFLTFPATGATSLVQQIGQRAPALLNADWRQRGLGQIEWQPTNHCALWRGLPWMTPFLKPTLDAGGEFVAGGLFPFVPNTNPPPADLLSQFVPRTNLVYYDWEVTQARLSQWRVIAQLFAVLANQPQLSTNSAALPWLMGIESHLGNTVTEVSAVSPREWSAVRKSHVGLTGCELTILARWLESQDFPRLSLKLPPEPRPEAKRPAAPKTRP